MNKGGFSWKRLSGISGAKSKMSRSTGIPFTKSGRNQKLGKQINPEGCGGCIVVLAVVGTFIMTLLLMTS